MTKILTKQGSIQFEEAPLVVVSLYADAAELDGPAAALDRVLSGAIREVIEAGDFKGKAEETLLLYSRGALPARRVLVVGLGEAERLTAETLRRVAAVVARRVRELDLTAYTTVTHGADSKVGAAAAAQALAEGTLLGLYRYREFKAPDDNGQPEVEEVTVIEADTARMADIQEGVRVGQIVAAATALARDLSNAPANIASPTYLADTARQLATQAGLRIEVLGPAEIESLGMGGLAAVARGSRQPAQFIILEHGTAGEHPTVALVGKGVTFDTGGISLKTAQGMEEMKTDMSGAAAVLGALQVAARLKLPLHVVGLIPATENMPDGQAYRPGDVLRMLSGTYVEIVNTDAEGRVILADALTYATRFKPAAVIDLATLTGGVITALGHVATGLMSNDDKLAARIKAAAEATWERVWELPLWDEYGDLIKSNVAAIKNSGGRTASPITGAMFLKHFAGDYAWAHLDIAGTAWDEKGGPYTTKGATGVGVRLLTWLLQTWRPAS